ncbi:hypothetical protein PI124_g3775 [Phytophthora idaei]|nr:hypothetical protein PI125_g6209 [Phytophthora idaei]KAG3168716.1 hypothetical protein PI126_g3200 [Phytophthora idaei]KAG3251627.1 hypothetical protein PI124_g3775 [Phytophthora idaei]
MERLGYSPQKLLAVAQQQQPEWDMSDVDDGRTNGVASILAYTGTTDMPSPADEEREMEDDENRACFPTFVDDLEEERDQIRKILWEKIDEARRFGASEEYLQELRSFLMQLIDVFRLIIGRDPPVDMPPMEITLKPGAVPKKCRARRYSQAHREFLKKHIDELIGAVMCYRNPKRRWCSPSHVVNKQEVGDYRMTVDGKGPNGCVEQLAWPMPISEVVFDRLRGSLRYFSFDFFKGFWQFDMGEWCQEIYSILTEEGVVTSTRVLMGVKTA